MEKERKHSKMGGQFNFAFCLAGKGKRFTEKNITVPKYLLKLSNDQTILERSIEEFNFPDQVSLYIVVNREHKDFVGQIEEILSDQDKNFKVIITDDTRGQAETGLIGCKYIENNHPVFFFNGDTILKNRDLEKMSSDLKHQYSGAIDIFLEDRNHFSFVQLSEDDLVEKIAEKVVISQYATTGLYGFSNKDVYIKYYNQIKTSAELYISDLYKLMIIDHEKIKGYVCTEESDTVILGTPDEYFSNKDKI
jgi:dTDP-glucose pyrophosphorylase